jgi:hypothetical protein
MKEVEQQKETKIEVLKQTQKESERVLLGSLKPKKGHTLFQYNKVTKEITIAKFDAPPIAEWDKITKGFTKSRKELTVVKDCIYIPALNKKNVIKILQRDFAITP